MPDNVSRKSKFCLPNPSTGDYEIHHFETELNQVVGLARQDSTAYAVGNIAFSASILPLFLKCTTAGTTAATEPSFSGAEVGGTVTDGTVVWQYYNLLSGSGVPLGSILPYSANAQTPPYGFLYAEGQAVSRTMYADLFALIGTTYGAGDGSTTFNLPNMIDKYLEGASTAGTVKSAGLPNITGGLTSGIAGNANPAMSEFSTVASGSGAFAKENLSSVGRYYTATGNTTSNFYHSLSFNASRSSSIYGNSDTVTPPTLTVRWIIKAYDAPTPSSAQIDLSQYASDLAARLTRELTPAFNKRDVITTSGTYTAPVTGWYRITAKGGGGGGQGGRKNSQNLGFGGGGGAEGGTTIGFEYMTAGQAASVVVGAGGTGGATDGINGSNGGSSSVTVNGNTYTGGGGGGGTALGAKGGTGTIQGAPGNSQTNIYSSSLAGSAGGGEGGAIGSTSGVPVAATNGGGGAGGQGVYQNGSVPAYAGGNGGAGFAWFEYFDGTLNP